MSDRIDFGIAGPGVIGKVHAEAIRNIPGAKLVAVWGRDAGKTAAFAGVHGGAAYTHYEQFLAHPGLHIVCVCSPSGLHAAHGVPAARAGRHVLVEKPIETTLAGADALINACDEAGVRLGVIFQSRFLPAVRRLKNALDEGRFGRLISGDAYVKWYRAPEYYAAGSWHGTREMDGGGALINQAIHTLDLLHWLMGPAEKVFAMKDALRYPHIEGEDTLAGTIRFRNGALGVIQAATSIAPGFRRRIEISGEKGTVILDGDVISHWSLPDDGAAGTDGAQITDGSADPKAISTEGHRIQIEEMMYAVRENRPPYIDGREGRRALELVTALYQSAETGQPVTL
ncbi:MAG: Gfo/Idh/MocA family protein [Blastocatellia bacterium]